MAEYPRIRRKIEIAANNRSSIRQPIKYQERVELITEGTIYYYRDQNGHSIAEFIPHEHNFKPMKTTSSI